MVISEEEKKVKNDIKKFLSFNTSTFMQIKKLEYSLLYNKNSIFYNKKGNLYSLDSEQ